MNSKASLIVASTLSVLLASVSVFAQETSSPYKTKATFADGKVEIVAQFDFRPCNVAVLPDGRVVFSYHPLGNKPNKFKVFELLADGSTKPFPNEQYAASPPNPETGIGIDDVLAVESDEFGNVWMLDKGGVDGRGAKLVVWSTKENKLLHSISIEAPVFQKNSFMQDLVIDHKRKKVYIADMTRAGLIDNSDPAIVTVDLATGESRRTLYNHESLNPAGDAFVIDGQQLGLKDGKGVVHEIDLGLNPITIDKENEWVYFGAMNSTTLYRIPASVLADASLSADDVRSKVEQYGTKAICDGIVAGDDGKIYTSHLNGNGINYTDKDGSQKSLVSDPKLSWVDGMSIGPDGKIYGTIDQLGRLGALNKGIDRTVPGEFYIFRVSPAGPVSIGR